MEPLVNQLALQAQRKYYGKYRGLVTDNADPEALGRLRLRVPSLLGETETGWALPCLPFGGLADQGLFTIPEIGATVWVEFEEGGLSSPIWTGTFWRQGSEVPSEAAGSEPTTRLLKTPSGHILQFDDESGAEQFRLVHPAGAQMTIDSNGTVAITDAQGAAVTLDASASTLTIEDANGNSITMSATGTTVEDANGNKIEMAPTGVKVQGQQIVIQGTQVMLGGQGGEPLVKGTSFLTFFNTHVHTCTAPGAPSSPPVPPLTPAALSLGVMTT